MSAPRFPELLHDFLLLMTGLLVDDDPLVVQTVEHFVEKCDLIEGCRHAGDGATAVNLLAGAEGCDVVLLDLHLPDVPGQSVLEAIPSEVPVIVISSDPGFGASSYQFPNVVDYLVKPLDYVRFHHALERAQQFRGPREAPPAAAPDPTRSRVIFVKSGNEIVRIVLSEIRYVKAEANYVSFHPAGAARPVMALTTLKHVAGELPENFLRVHRSYIVNREHIDRVDGQSVWVDGERLPIGESFRSEFLSRLGIIA